MADKTIAIYCFIHDFLQATGHKTDVHCKLNDAEIATTALIAALYFGGNHAKARDYMQHHHGLKMIDKSGFNRRLHRLEATLLTLFRFLATTLKQLNTSARYVIDSFPVAVCCNCRIPVCKLLQGKAYHGYNEAKKEYFYGFKVQVIVSAANLPVVFFYSAGSFADITAFQSMNIDLPEGSDLYGDKGYVDYDLEDLYAECEGVRLQIHRKSNSLRPDAPWDVFLKKHFRKPIETVFSEITNLFGRKIHAVTAAGFLLKVFLFLFAFTIDGCLE
jgi:hypothetical protein